MAVPRSPVPGTLGARPSPCGGPKSDFKGHLVSCASARAPSLFSSRTTPGWKHHEETKGYNIASSNFTVTRTPMVPGLWGYQSPLRQIPHDRLCFGTVEMCTEEGVVKRRASFAGETPTNERTHQLMGVYIVIPF